MGKLLLAFSAGAALTSLAFVLIGGARTALAPEQSAVVAPPNRSAPKPIRDIAPLNETPNVAEVVSAVRASVAVTNGAGLTEEVTRVALSYLTREELLDLEERAREMTEPTQQMLEAERVMRLALTERLRRERITRWADAPPPELPIQLPSEFSWLSEYPNRTHEQLQREPIDSTWSPSMEAHLLDFFATRPLITGRYGFPTINCRTSACEIAFVAYGIGDSERADDRGFDAQAQTEFMTATEEFYEQPWAEQLNRAFPIPRIQDGATTFLWIMGRVED